MHATFTHQGIVYEVAVDLDDAVSITSFAPRSRFTGRLADGLIHDVGVGRRSGVMSSPSTTLIEAAEAALATVGGA